MSVSKLESFVKHLDTFTEYTGRIISWFSLIMVLLTFTIVILRYGFNIGWIAMQESVLYFHGFAFMLGAAYTLKHDGHVRVDIFYQKFSPRNKAHVNFFGSLLLLLPVCITIAVISWDYVATSWRILEASGEAGGLPFVFLSKSLLILLALTLGIQGIAELLRSLKQIQESQEHK
ncbi:MULTISPECIES: TRAP transporter small permease subunit [Thalassotalea]|uniref:TRAP transporter small permease subunit n=1 Tax=Thalassotalea TaxID=1518149 RepID=UPI0009432453|nr:MULTISPECIES: TRAP transporter small permease subunit [Thalassotalea]OKY26924.1 hypothetical protein BI291_11115 [Thalassotalea sp. PP2-459]